MPGIDDIKRKMATVAEIPQELVRGLPLITMTGSEAVVIENSKSLIEYSDERVRVLTSCGVVMLTGKNLIISAISASSVSVGGRIASLEFLP